MKVFVYEHVSGGGYISKELPISVLSEGYSMLRTLVSDFAAAGHTVKTCLDGRLQKLRRGLRASEVDSISSPQELAEKRAKALESVDWSYIIAPESDGILQDLVRKAKIASSKSLNSKTKTVRRTSDKLKTFERLEQKDVLKPETHFLKLTEQVGDIRDFTDEIGYPLVFKPVDGVSCEGVNVVKERNHVDLAIQKIKQVSSIPTLVVQKFIQGVHASVSLLTTGERALPLTLNKQLLSLNVPSSSSTYEGGIVPFQHSLREEAFTMARRAVEAFPDLRGYVGVDMILTDQNPVVVEINPRLTTSYIGMRKPLRLNLAHAISRSVVEGRLPQRVQRTGVTFFSKVSLGGRSPPQLPTLFSMDEVVTPPLVLSDILTIPALLASYSHDLRNAKGRFATVKKYLLRAS